MPKVSEFPYQAPTAATKIPVVGETHFLVGDIAPAKEYRAILNQSLAADPVARILKNSFGATLVWTRAGFGVGIYRATLAGAFPFAKTYVIVGSIASIGNTDLKTVLAVWEDEDNILVTTRLTDLTAGTNDLSDSVLFETPIEIDVYP